MRNTNPSAAVVAIVRRRDEWRCARCGQHEHGLHPLTTQHRVARGMGGTRAAWINEPPNLLTLCGSGTTGCHGWVESHPTEARRLGLSVARWSAHDLHELPVYTWRGWVYLTESGEWADADRPLPDRGADMWRLPELT